MKTTHVLYIFSIAITLLFVPPTASAQNVVQCGDIISGEFQKEGETHAYEIEVNSTKRLYILVEETGEYSDVFFQVRLYDPSGREIEFSQDTKLASVRTENLPGSGTYKIEIYNGIVTSSVSSGTYNLYIDCVEDNGKVTSSGRFVQSLQCGNIIEHQFYMEGESHRYFISLSNNDKLSATIEETGSYSDLYFQVGLYDSDNREIESKQDGELVNIETEALPASDIYQMVIYNGIVTSSVSSGTYSLYVGCTLSDGTTIQPGDTLPEISSSPPTSAADLSDSALSGFGFPGLAPVDFSGTATFPLPESGPTNGVIQPSGNEVLGFTFGANAGDVLDLTYRRGVGNLNLGIVVLSANNEVVFQASLVTSETLSTRFTLPSAGEYTIGVFRVDLLPPGDPQPTAFQLQGTLNP